MEFAKTTLLITFAEAFQPWVELRAMIRAMTDNPKGEISAPPMVVNRTARKQKVELQVRGLRLHQEGEKSIADTVAPALDFLAKINHALPIPKSSNIKYDAIFLEPYTLPFHDLVALIKSRFFQRNLIIDNATDVGVLFDTHEGKLVKHIQLGPMEAQQLQTTYLAFQREKIPERFVFINVGYERSDQADFDLTSLREFLETATKWHIEQAEMMVSELRSKGG